MGAGAELRNCYSEFDVFYSAEVGFCAKSCFNDIICPQYRISICALYGSAPFVFKILLHFKLADVSEALINTSYVNIIYIFDKSSTLVIQFENPCSCKRNSWLYTCCFFLYHIAIQKQFLPKVHYSDVNMNICISTE